ncbi:Telomere-associated protein Rif [Parasponia andersonii]|uniref:Telomere-associated protein Rif n=1 Tax=Parasponia andersonii TaxID=3476 RepID=A0A2P5DUV8_PARAD|nr:Telomere-associated protein Rif [Parasponia andersonii]
MSNFSDQLHEIKASISSGTNKSFAYSTLLYLQEQSTNSSASIQALAEAAPSLVPLMVADVHDQDEEIAGQALKCLGFIMYHPSLCAAISVERVNLVLESLVKLITTTKMKSVCNLGVWCISIQQFNEPVLVPHFDSLLQAVVHGLENPMGSLSATFEAIQAVMRLAVQLAEKMRGLSHVWAPSIYRRLLSFDKRERDMSERCLLKIKSLILPPSRNLSKVLVKDMKQTLLTRMKDLLNHGSKIQAIRAWGWFIQLLGPYALKNRNLINDVLKIPEHTFSDHDPQLQIASQVAWQGLIDALIHPAILPYTRNDVKGDKCFQQTGTSTMENNEIQANGFLKSLKLIMTPVIGFMSSNCDASVYMSSFNTWCYLLYKLGASVNYSSVKKLVLQPVSEAVFQIGPDYKGMWVWNLCLDLVDDLLLANCRDVDNESSCLASSHLSATTFIGGPFTSGKCPWMQYPIKWLPWELSQLDFHLKIISSLTIQVSKITVSHEKRTLAYDASLRLFRSLLKGVQVALRKASTAYDDIFLCLNTILRFIKYLCEEHSEGSDRNDLHNISLRLIEVVVEEIEPAILGSPLYKVALDLKYIESQSILDKIRLTKVSGMCSLTYMGMVSPVVYLTVLYFSVMAQTNLNTSSANFILPSTQKYFRIMLSSHEQENFVSTVGLLYKHRGPSCFRMWTAIAESVKDYICDMKNISLFKLEYNNAYVATCDLLFYPLIICYCHQEDFMSAKISGSVEESHISLQRKLELEQVIEVWKSLYCSLRTSQLECFTAKNFPQDLCHTLDGWLDSYTCMFESTNRLESGYKDLDLDQIFFGGVVTCILEKFRSSELSPDGKNGCSRDQKISSGITSCLTMAIRFMRFLQTKIDKATSTILVMASRLYSALAHFISCLGLKHDILSLVEIISSPLLQWLAQIEMQDVSNNDLFQLIWSEILNCLKRSQPPLIFDSAFLKLQSPLLEKTLDHPNPSISEPTICFWNSTYGDQIKLDYPQNLLHVLDKLSRDGRINLHKKCPSFLERCDRVRVNTALEEYRLNATHNMYWKRMELLNGNTDHTNKQKDGPCLNLKRKRLELTEHQKEVRRAQQGRERDCGGHGLGGIRTYTNLDFSQGNGDSQDSQEIRNLESILDTSEKA